MLIQLFRLILLNTHRKLLLNIRVFQSLRRHLLIFPHSSVSFHMVFTINFLYFVVGFVTVELESLALTINRRSATVRNLHIVSVQVLGLELDVLHNIQSSLIDAKVVRFSSEASSVRSLCHCGQCAVSLWKHAVGLEVASSNPVSSVHQLRPGVYVLSLLNVRKLERVVIRERRAVCLTQVVLSRPVLVLILVRLVHLFLLLNIIALLLSHSQLWRAIQLKVPLVPPVKILVLIVVEVL